MAALSTRLLSVKQSSMARPPWRQAAPTALPSASTRAAVTDADSSPSWSQPASVDRMARRMKGRRSMAKDGSMRRYRPSGGSLECSNAKTGRAWPPSFDSRSSQHVSACQQLALQPLRDRDALAAGALHVQQRERAVAAGHDQLLAVDRDHTARCGGDVQSLDLCPPQLDRLAPGLEGGAGKRIEGAHAALDEVGRQRPVDR